jgi:hypothetical protein
MLGAFAQRTVGTISYDPMKAYDGYNLFYPHNQPNVYLLDNCGRIVHVWEDDASFRPGNTAYLMENGNLIKTKRPAAVANDPIWAGGGGATVEIRSWDNDLLWTFTLNDSLYRLHHDIEPLPNGNILMLAWEKKTAEEAIQAGRDTSLLPDGELWPDYLIEVEPVGESDFNIVWEWHIWDHLVQDYDATKDNFGVVVDAPSKMDINYTSNDGGADWMHSNSIDYNEDLRQVLISIPFFDEVWVIDHSTSTEQAAGETGGLAGRGGEILYRWGNPAVYDSGTAEDQTLFFNHDAHWVDQFLDFSHPDYGKIAVFNNRVGADYSTVNIFTPPFDMYSWGYTQSGSTFGPDEFDWTAQHPVDSTLMWSTGLSSIQVLPNGNTLICVGRFGYVFEMTPDEEIVWEYKTPLMGGNPVSQGDTLAINNNLTFKVTRYPADYEAFDGRDLDGEAYIELNPDIAFCASVGTELDNVSQYQLKLFPNPAKDQLVIEWEGGLWVDIEIIDILGRRVDYFIASGGRKYHNIAHLQQGMYYVRVNQSDLQKLMIVR